MELSFPIISILLASGLVVGFINTLAGGGSAISLTVFMALGLPVDVANGTNRIAILMQNLSSTATFLRKGML
ncbi:MAG: TSUP family transporter, partial [Alistipes sp.]|nr:TSUP family transporter [Alistipes sp.]